MMARYDLSSGGVIKSVDDMHQAVVNVFFMMSPKLPHGSGQALLAQLDRELAADRASVESLLPVTLEECEGWIDGLLLAAAQNEDPNIWGHRLWDTIVSHNVRCLREAFVGNAS